MHVTNFVAVYYRAPCKFVRN
uniref:Uncharacterized protein n=1 Tax=Anguilla anguilla TaxID=7936 RepID=A0A0E9V0Z1_ANGAN